MNDYELDRALDAIYQGRADLADPPQLHERAFAVPTEYPQRRGWLPHIDTRGFTMFSALKFVAAAAIVALFGGFLLAGVFTTQQGDDVLPAAVTESPEPEATTTPTEPGEPVVRTDILPGVEVTVEEVEPGVFHVVNDGVRDLVLGGNTDVVAGHDDGIWLLRKSQFFRLGSEAGQAWPEGGRPQSSAFPRFDIFEVAPDGTVWVIQTERVPHPRDDFSDVGSLFSSTGDGWNRAQTPGNNIVAIAVAPDGTLWATWREWTWNESEREMHVLPWIGHLGPSGWEPLVGQMDFFERLHPIASGALYAQGCIYGTCAASRYEDGYWSAMDGWIGTWDVAPDGTVWLLTYGFDPNSDPEGLARFAGGTWEEWGPDDLPDMGLGIALERGGAPTSTFRAAPDGSLWASLWQRGPDGDKPPASGLWTGEQRGNAGRYDPECDGLVRFDGEAVDHFLPGRCITMDIAADSSVWVLADEEEGKDLYVITSEAVAATE